MNKWSWQCQPPPLLSAHITFNNHCLEMFAALRVSMDIPCMLYFWLLHRDGAALAAFIPPSNVLLLLLFLFLLCSCCYYSSFSCAPAALVPLSLVLLLQLFLPVMCPCCFPLLFFLCFCCPFFPAPHVLLLLFLSLLFLTLLCFCIYYSSISYNPAHIFLTL